MQEISVEVQPDYLERLSQVRKPILAVAELIWNGFDADAKNVRVNVQHNSMGGLESVRVHDDGHGIEHAEAEPAFRNLGGSLKRNRSHSKNLGRMLHGKAGRGRFRAFALGRRVEWNTTFEQDSQRHTYTIAGSRITLGKFQISDLADANGQATGTEVVITDIEKNFRSITGSQAILDITELFALYLRSYPDVQIWYEGTKIDPSQFEHLVRDYSLEPIQCDDGREVDATLTVIEWTTPMAERSLYLCDGEGFALSEMPPGIQAPGFIFTAYLKSSLIRDLDNQDALPAGELHPDLHNLVDAAKEKLREHFRKRSAEAARNLVSEWKKQEIYPYQGEPRDILETTERQVFDVLALNVNDYLPDFDKSDAKSKRFSMRLLKQALEKNPKELQHIFQEVLELPDDKRKELASLLERTTLAAIINASKEVADRLDFIHGLKMLVFDPESKEQLRERDQLHKILAERTWLFGEQFALSVNEQSLTEVLNKHLHLLGREPDNSTPVVRDDGSMGRVDLMLSRAIPHPDADAREHLVVELKRPNQPLNRDIADQIESYAVAVAKDERFRDTNTRWVFWAISNEMDETVRRRSRQPHRAEGILFEEAELRITVWARTWGQVLRDCESRLRFFQDKLTYSASDASALAHLREMHEKYLPPRFQGDGQAGNDDG